jgi:hypothetical protein
MLITVEELNGWSEPNQNEEIYDDGMCRIFINQTVEDYGLVNCAIYKSSSYNIKVLKDYYANSQTVFVDFEIKTKHKYDYEFDLYAYIDSGGYPKYTLLLETDKIVYSVAVIIPRFESGTKFEDGIKDGFGDEIDDLLHEVVLINLEKSK